MHYAVLVVLEDEREVTEDVVLDVIESSKDTHWDWFSIGGRWSGLFDGYDPEKDPANRQPCSLCLGSGKRADMEVMNGCNGCSGTGVATKWPTEWAQHPGDVQPIVQLTEEQYKKFHSVAVSGYGWFSGERYEPWQADNKFPSNELPPLEWLKTHGKTAVVVDCHN